MLIEYPKIETVFERSTDGNKKLIPWQFRNPAIQFLRNNIWECTEKVDGTNIRVYWDGHTVGFYGRTDRADIPKNLLAFLQTKFCNNETEEMFEQMFGDKEVILFGEGYGPKIQKGGGLYRDDVSFILFDIYINGFWLKRMDMKEVAQSLGIDVVPLISLTTLDEAVKLVTSKPQSTINPNHELEGLVCRPAYPLNDRNGDRIIVKIKARDF